VMILTSLPMIKSVFVMSIASKLSLETLTIISCDELETLNVFLLSNLFIFNFLGFFLSHEDYE